MQRALIDTSVLFAAAYRRDIRHEPGLAIVRGIDDADLPEAVVSDHILAETLNGLTAKAGHGDAVDFLHRLEENERFHVERLPADAFATAKSLFEAHSQFSFVDATIVALARSIDAEYCYSFDDDFDRAEGLTRLDTAVDPYGPE